MANEANVTALRALVMACNEEAYYDDRGALLDRLPEFLASQGVLVPSALTDEECLIVKPVIHPANTGDYEGDIVRWIRGSLEVIAKQNGLTDDQVYEAVELNKIRQAKLE